MSEPLTRIKFSGGVEIAVPERCAKALRDVFLGEPARDGDTGVTWELPGMRIVFTMPSAHMRHVGEELAGVIAADQQRRHGTSQPAARSDTILKGEHGEAAAMRSVYTY